MYNNLLLAADGEQVSLHCACSISDTVDHDLLMLRLEHQFGLRGVVISWFRSCLSNRTFRVLYGGTTSSMVYIVCSVPQGSVLGPPLFILYTSDLPDVTEKHGVTYAFADAHSCICTVVATIWRLLLYDLSVASWKSAIGCLPIGSR